MKNTLRSPVSTHVPLPDFDAHVLKRVFRFESDFHDPRPLTNEEIDADIQEYLGFLRQHKIAGEGVNILPSVRVDRVWHIHIIQTADYAEVCAGYLGYFLHHASMICFEVKDWGYDRVREEIERGNLCLMYINVSDTITHVILGYGFKNDEIIFMDPMGGTIRMDQERLEHEIVNPMGKRMIIVNKLPRDFFEAIGGRLANVGY